MKEEQKELKKNIYRDNSAGQKIVFECTAKDILDADKLYQKETGKDPVKQSYISCSTEKITNENSPE